MPTGPRDRSAIAETFNGRAHWLAGAIVCMRTGSNMSVQTETTENLSRLKIVETLKNLIKKILAFDILRALHLRPECVFLFGNGIETPESKLSLYRNQKNFQSCTIQTTKISFTA